MPQSAPFQGAALPLLRLFPPFSFSKKVQGITGSPSSGHPPAVCSQQSPQQKTATLNKRVSNQSPLRSPLRSPENLSSSESSTSSSGDDDEMLVGKDTNNKIKTPFVLPAKRTNPLPQGTQLKVRRVAATALPWHAVASHLSPPTG